MLPQRVVDGIAIQVLSERLSTMLALGDALATIIEKSMLGREAQDAARAWRAAREGK